MVKDFSDAKSLRDFEMALKALGSIVRLNILRSVSKEAKPVSTIAKEVGISPASCSSHINTLWKAGFLHRYKRGNQVFYKLDVDHLLSMQKAIRKFLRIEE